MKMYILEQSGTVVKSVLWLNYSDNFLDKSEAAYLMRRQSTYISFYEEAEISSNPLPDCEPVSVNHSLLVSLWKAILMSFGGTRQSFSRSFGILGVLWKSLRGAAMNQKLDNSPTSLQLLNLCTSCCYPFKLNQHSINPDERAAIF